MFSVWLKRTAAAFVVIFWSSSLIAAEPDTVLKREGKLNADLTNPGSERHPSWFSNSFLDLREDVKVAADANKRLLLFFYQDGCPYCKKILQINLAQKNIEEKLRSSFDVLAINMWGDRTVTDLDGESLSEKDFAKKMRVNFTPTLVFFDLTGSQALRVNGYYTPPKFLAALNYVTEGQPTTQSFRDYFSQLNPPSARGELTTEPFFKPLKTLHAKRAKNRHLAVYFEQKDCPSCDELHKDVLARKATLKQVNRLDNVQLNMWAADEITTPDGRQMTAAAWANELDIKYAPSIVYFDSSGKEVARIEAYFRSFHVQSVYDYVAQAAYVKQPSFQRFIEARADALRKKGVTIDIME